MSFEKLLPIAILGVILILGLAIWLLYKIWVNLKNQQTTMHIDAQVNMVNK